MLRSYRINPSLEERLREVAAREGVPVSTVVREAITRHCDAVLGADLQARLAYVTGAVESDGGRARRTGRAFTAALTARARR